MTSDQNGGSADAASTRGDSPAKSTSPPFQFGIKHLLAGVVWVAVLLAIATQLPFTVTLLYLFLSWIGLCEWRKASRVLTYAVPVIALLVTACVISLGPGAHEAAPRATCINNLKQIGLALYMYHDTYGCFPPAYIADERGRPIHSWRVLILPFLEHQDLYGKYRFDEPWDGPNNSKLHAADIAGLFYCPSDENAPPGQTNYVAVVGPATAWHGAKSVRPKDITDGPYETILLVEVANSGIHWMEPRDLHVVQMKPRLNAKAGQGPSSKHAGNLVNVLLADGSARSLLADELPPEVFQAMLTISGGEKIDPDEP